jgi:hypothetical protein
MTLRIIGVLDFVLETGSVYILRCREEDAYSLGSLRKS